MATHTGARDTDYHPPMEESTINFPKPDLSELVWNKDGDTYSLKSEVEKKIWDTLKKYPKADLPSKITELHVVGSIGTNQYDDSADIDVHFLMPAGSLGDEMTDEEWQQDIKKFFKENQEEFDLYIGEHPLEFYWQLNPDQELLADAFYNVTEKEWVKGPKLVDPSFNPYEKYKDALDDLRDILGDSDKLIGELKRDVIDYDVIKNALHDAPKEVQMNIKNMLQSKADEIQHDIDTLFKNRKEWVEMRKRSSTPDSPDQAMQDAELAKKWDHANAMFKFLDRYQYMTLIGDLEKFIEDEELTDDEIKQVQGLLTSTDGAIR
jgi:hypothetical protein